jgi:hypothetical protein
VEKRSERRICYALLLIAGIRRETGELAMAVQVPAALEVQRRLAALDSGPDQLQTPAAGGRMAG